MENNAKKNLAIIEQKYPSLHKKVIGILENNNNEENIIEVTNTKTGLINFRITRGNKSSFLHSNYDPYKESHVIASSIEEGTFDTIIILGLGLTYHLKDLLSTYKEKNKIIVEPDYNIFVKSLEYIDLEEILNNSNTELIVSNESDEVFNELAALYHNTNIYSLKFVQLGYYNNIYGGYWQDIQREYIKFFNNQVINIRTIQKFNMMWIYNFFMNILKIEKTANIIEFKNKFKGIPAVIVAAGPSLKNEIEMIKTIKNKALIIAAGSSVNALIKNDIIPHIMLGIDGGNDMSEIYNQVKRDDILFTYVCNMHFDCVNKYKGPMMYIRSNSEPHVDYFETAIEQKTEYITAGGSVANVSLDFAVKLGCNPLVLVGQDLAYTDMMTRVEGTIGADDYSKKPEIMKNDKRFVETEDMYGNPIYTNQVFLTMKYWFEEYFKNNNEKNTFINATTGGLSLNYAEKMKLKEVIDRYCNHEYNFREKIQEYHSNSIRLNKVRKADVIDFVKKIYENVLETKKMSDERISKCNKIIQEVKKGVLKNSAKQLKKINKITEKIEKEEYFKVFILTRSREIINAYKNTSEQKASKETDIPKKLLILYEGLKMQFLDIEEKLVFMEVVCKEILDKEEAK